jgi:hypothetical protein
MEEMKFIIAIIATIPGIVALIWNIRNDIRRVRLVFLGSRILLLNYTKRPVNIDSVGFKYKDGTSSEVFSPDFDPFLVIPPENQKDVVLENFMLTDKVKHVYARDILGKIYRKNVGNKELNYWMNFKRQIK